jgi:flavin reductase (DIM6/NTAB) family NADH-FMN oxidoreductase RutF
MKVSVPLEKAYQLLNHGPTVLVSAAHEGMRNLMTAAWVMPLDVDPPKVVAVISSGSRTRKLFDQSGEFAVNIPSAEMVDLAFSVGRTKGAEVDKFEHFGIRTFPGSCVRAPLIEGCLGWLECRTISEPAVRKTYDLILADVVAAWTEKDLFGSDGWVFDPPNRATVHHLGGGRFAVPARTVTAKKLK